jgi:hypothetical protein
MSLKQSKESQSRRSGTGSDGSPGIRGVKFEEEATRSKQMLIQVPPYSPSDKYSFKIPE